MNATAKASRQPGIDLLRGLTVAVMILVNQWAGVSGLPGSFALAAPHVGGGGHATHALLVRAGMAAALLLHGRDAPARATQFALLLGSLLLATGFNLRPHWPLSKIDATPSWGLVCAGATLLLYLVLRPLADGAAGRAALVVLGDAARHPLLAYLIPFVLGAVTALVAWDWPASLSTGWAGIARGLVFLAWVLVLLKLFLRAGLRLRL